MRLTSILSLLALVHPLLTNAEADADPEPFILTSYYVESPTTVLPASTHHNPLYTLPAEVASITVDIKPTVTPIPKPLAVSTTSYVNVGDTITYVAIKLPPSAGAPIPTSAVNQNIQTIFYAAATYEQCSGGPKTTTLAFAVPEILQPHITPLASRTVTQGKYTTVYEELPATYVDPAEFASSSRALAPDGCNVYRIATATASPDTPCHPLPFPKAPNFRCGPSDPCCKNCELFDQFCLSGTCGNFPHHYFDCPNGLQYNVGGGTALAGQFGASPTGGSTSPNRARSNNGGNVAGLGFAVGFWALVRLFFNI